MRHIFYLCFTWATVRYNNYIEGKNMSVESGLLNLLVEKNIISGPKKSVVQGEVEEYEKSVIATVINLSYAEPKQLMDLLAEEYDLPSMDFSQFNPKTAPQKYLNEEYCMKYEMVPIGVVNNTLYLAVSDPSCINAIEGLDAFSTKYAIPTDMILVEEDKLQRALTVLFRKNINLDDDEKQEGSWYD